MKPLIDPRWQVVTVRQAYKGWEVGSVHSTLLESVMSGGESVGMTFDDINMPFSF